MYAHNLFPHNCNYSTNKIYTFINQECISLNNLPLLHVSNFIPCFIFVYLLICNQCYIIVENFPFYDTNYPHMSKSKIKSSAIIYASTKLEQTSLPK